MAEYVEGQPTDDEDGYKGDPNSSKPWLTCIADAEKVFKAWQDKSDNVDKLYADLERLSNTARDRQFQLFWANISVVGPSSYSRPPVPVVVPRFKDRKPLPRAASELLERTTIVTFEMEDIDSVMRLIRDDMNILARGAAWVRYEAAAKDNNLTERVCIEHRDRKDFLHEAAREWKDVDWVASRSWMTKGEMRKRFYKTSGKAYQDASFEERKDDKKADDGKLKAGVWELWCKSENKVVWVTEGVEVCLDEGEPHLTLEGFFPCPRPAYSTIQRRTLIPVPDMLFYKDQIEEINELTARIGAISEAIKVRGFYQAGAGEIGDAIETAVKATTNNAMLIPIANVAAMSGQAFKDAILWMPLDMLAEVITQLVALRKQLIEDVYQITGLSDIMRGQTEASETLGAQQLKSQYGSIRIKDRQAELVRFARDLTRITAEIQAENFQQKTMLDMSQFDIKSNAQVQQEIAPLVAQIKSIEAELAHAQRDPETVALAKQNPQQAQQIMGQAQQQAQQLQQQIAGLKQTVTIEQVMAFLRDQRLRPFELDIETDSTIQPDEDAAKQRATEFVTAVGGFMREAMPLVQTVPQSANLMSETLKFVASQYRAGRPLQGAIEEFADQMKQIASQPKQPDPETVKAQSEAQATQAVAAEKTANAQRTTQEAQDKAQNEDQARQIRAQEAADASKAREAEISNKTRLTDIQIAQGREKHAQDMEIGAQQLLKTHIEVERLKAEALKPDATETEKGPSESIAFKDLPPDGQAQMAEQAGIHLTPEALKAHADALDAKKLAEKAAAKPKAKEPA